MNVKVSRSFADKRTGTVHKAGEKLTVTAGRFAEINGTPTGVLVEEIKETDVKKKVR